MFWMKKAMTAAVLAVCVLGAGLLALGTSGRSANVAQANEPLGEGGQPAKKAPEDPDPLKRLEKRLADLEKQKELLDATLEDIRNEKRKLEAEKKEKDDATEAAALGKDIEVSVGANDWPRPYLVREVVNGRVVEMTCSSLDLLTTYLARAKADPKGPKNMRVTAYKDHSMDELRKVFAACAAAGYAKAQFSQTERPAQRLSRVALDFYIGTLDRSGAPKPGEIDLKQYAEPKKP